MVSQTGYTGGDSSSIDQIRSCEEEDGGMVVCCMLGVNNNNNSSCSRKRKEHDLNPQTASQDDICGQDCKSSKSSEFDIVGKYMRNWMADLTKENSPQNERRDDPPTIMEVQNKPGSWTMFSSHEAKENDNLGDSRGEARWNTLGSSEPEKCNLIMTSTKHLEENFSMLERQNKSSPKKSKSRQISKKLSSIKTKIEEAEAEFEAKRGHRLSPADKMKDEALGNLKLEQVNLRLKQDVKTAKGGAEGEARSRIKTSSVSVSRFTVSKSAERDRDKIVKNLEEMRKSKDRPTELDRMTAEQMSEEKLDLQSQLIEYEKLHGLPANQSNREVMADLYERYRLVLRQTRRTAMARWSVTSLPGGMGELMSIPEDKLINIAGSERRRSLETPGFRSTSPSWASLPLVQLFTDNRPIREHKDVPPPTPEHVDYEEKYHTMTQSELVTSLKKMRVEKKIYKRQLKNIEEEFKSKNGINLCKEDKEALGAYKLYKELKPKIKLVDALLCKYSTISLDH